VGWLSTLALIIAIDFSNKITRLTRLVLLRAVLGRNTWFRDGDCRLVPFSGDPTGDNKRFVLLFLDAGGGAEFSRKPLRPRSPSGISLLCNLSFNSVFAAY
jgi:hypothetical protein